MEKNTTSTPSKDALDAALVDILSADSPDARALFAFIELRLRQFRLSSRIEAYEILVEAYLRGRRYQESGAAIRLPLAWLRKTAFNIILERSRQALKEQSLYSSQIEFLSSRDESLDSEDIKEDLVALHKALELLGQQDPEALSLLHLRNVKGLSWREIQIALKAEAKDAPTEAALRQQGFRALKRLRQIFHEIQPSL